MITESTAQPSFTPVPKPEKKEKKKPKFIKRKSAAKKKKRKKKIKYLPVAVLKKIEWRAFSRYIRAVRDAAPDQIGFSVCYTCGKEGRWQDSHCGHYEERNKSGSFTDERNNHTQCEACNIHRKGNYKVYARNLVRDYGKNILQELADLNRKPFKRTHEEWIKLILKYERKLTEAGIDCPARPKQLTVE